MVPVVLPPVREQAVEGREALRWLRSRLRLRPGRTLVAIDGLRGAGKAGFADELADLLADCGAETVRISLADYGLTESDPEPLRAFLEDVIEPLGSEGSGRYRTAFTDGEGRHRWACVAGEAVVLVEGGYLHGCPFHGRSGERSWDLSVWLESATDDTGQLSVECAGEDADPSSDSWQRYLRECAPAERADLVVDNRLPHSPVD